MENTKLAFTSDQKAVVEREVKNAYSTMATLLEWVESDSLTGDMRETLPNLIEGYLKTIKDAIGFTGEESERMKELNKSMGQYLEEQIKDLEKALENHDSIGAISANVKQAFKKVNKWWDIEGFEYIRKEKISSGGTMQLELGFSLDSFTSYYSTTPITDKEAVKTKVQYLMEKGFQFAPKKRGFGSEILDNDNNRALLIEIIKEAFPSARITRFDNRLRLTNDVKDDCFTIIGVEVIVMNLLDVEKLHVEEKKFLFDENSLG